jgi:4,5-DOPA dioxygenase extradiol
MSPETLPSLFLSHGAPTLPLEEGETTRFLAALPGRLPRPRAILCVSAHWQTDRPMLGSAGRLSTIHDFYGFPDALYRLQYPADGAPWLAERAAGLLEEAGLRPGLDDARGLDHGAWVPLLLMYPRADIPVVPLSIMPHRPAGEHLAMGRALAPLAAEGVLVLGSGGAVHNLGELAWRGRGGDGGTPAWAAAFDAWLDRTLTGPAPEAVADWLTQAPEPARAHPSPDHFLPLPVAVGAAGPGASGRRLHAEFVYGSLSMAAWSFDPATGA